MTDDDSMMPSIFIVNDNLAVEMKLPGAADCRYRKALCFIKCL